MLYITNVGDASSIFGVKIYVKIVTSRSAHVLYALTKRKREFTFSQIKHKLTDRNKSQSKC